ncbi:MAG: hypothetical protein CMM03_01765 [Rhodopirellula sp.]|jgi:hypothetical protein|nr:hypothetical protein [Rhodopirellula sp.]|tara:strand:- start:772 stop:987 length:216 start_codon:yes stop_codon:yes gene_type:complete
MTIERVSQDEMLSSFKERLAGLLEENKKKADEIKQNEITALKLQGAIEALEYYNRPEPEETASHPPDETEE